MAPFKYTFFLATLVLLSITASSQPTRPDMASLGKTSIHRLPDGRYIAVYRKKKIKYHAFFKADSSWISTESKIKWTRQLPKPVHFAWDHCNYRDWLILDMKKIETPGQTEYALHIGQVQSLGPDDADIGTELILHFAETGSLLKTERL